MAVTKIKPIRGTVNKALAYILDPQKTDDAFYVSSYGCAASDAAAKEFEWTRNLAVQQGMQMPKVLARHLIQSFDIGEVTPEEAHEVGKQLADEWLKGKYEYVIATHIDKGHCHNHIIFNAVNYVDFHAYRSNKRTYRELRQLSDEICKEHGLSVIPPSQNKGMDYKEYTEAKRGTSWKQKLIKLHLEADVFAAAVIQTNHRIVELRLLRRVKPGHSAPALVQQLLCDLLGQLLFLAGKELVVFPQAEGAFLTGTIEVALAHIDRRAAAGAFADFLLARAETLGFGIGEKRVGFHEIPGHPDNAAEEGVCIRIAALNLHERVFPFRRHCGRRDLFRQNTDEVAAVLCGNKGFAFALCKAGLHQLFNDTGAGCGSAETFLLGVIVKLIVSGSLHCRQERVF